MIPERRITAQELVLTGLRTDILTGELGPGDQVVQELLAERYGVSRVPLREALKTLESEGQVVYYPHRGYFVAELSVADLMEVYRLRSLLEAEAIRHAVRSAIASPTSRASSARSRCPNSGSSRWASNNAFAR